jgi:hypothetical protein
MLSDFASTPEKALPNDAIMLLSSAGMTHTLLA